MNFSTRYKPPKSPTVKFVLPSLTDQSQAKDADINHIMERYRETGYLTDPLHPSTRKPSFGDFTSIPDYQECLAIIDKADAAFATLPAKVRDRFANDPSQIFAFLADEKNRAEAIELGLIAKPVETKPVTSPADDTK